MSHGASECARDAAGRRSPAAGPAGPTRLPRLVVTPAGHGASDADAAPLAGAEAWLDAKGGVFAYCRVRGDVSSILLPGVATFRFAPDGDAVLAEPDPSVAPETVPATYDRHVLPLVLQALGTEVLHASAVRGPRGVAVFCGGTGTGKSTVAFGLSCRGYPLWADDAVALEFSEGAVRAARLPFEPRLRPSAAQFFGASSAAGGGGAAGGGEATGEGAFAPVACVAILCRATGPRAVAVRRLGGGAALAAVLPHAQCFRLDDRDPKRRMIERYLALTSRVPVLAVDFALGFDVLPAVLDRIERVALGAGDVGG